MVDRHHPGKAPTALLHRLARAKECLTIEALAVDLDLTHRQVTDAASKLLRRNYLERMAVGCYQLTEEGIAAEAAGEVIKSGPMAPHGKRRDTRNTLRQRAWTAMRIRRVFTVPDLVSDAETGEDREPEDNIRRYLKALTSVGYVAAPSRRLAGSSRTGAGFGLYRLLRNTGPRAPSVLSKTPGIHDFNLGEDVLCSPR